ncbi:hypothetical protein KHA80_00445 [Anaerobacillus sp. HL2]|nr:hypothetical protein KHA80_00445 [Anaerobacillus sp. HL2]
MHVFPYKTILKARFRKISRQKLFSIKRLPLKGPENKGYGSICMNYLKRNKETKHTIYYWGYYQARFGIIKNGLFTFIKSYIAVFIK